MWNKNQLYFYVSGKMRTCTSKSTIYNRSNKEEIRCLGINPAKKMCLTITEDNKFNQKLQIMFIW